MRILRGVPAGRSSRWRRGAAGGAIGRWYGQWTVGILEEDIARVRAATDASAVIGEQVALRKVGNSFVGLCPFHAESSPSFNVNPREGLYFCFGCQASGDVITFVRETQHVDFAAAVEYLAAKVGIQLRYDTPGATREHHRRAELVGAMEEAVEFYHQRLMTSDDAARARRYLRAERGYDAEVVREFKLGWAPEGWDTLCRALHQPFDRMEEAGLALRNRVGRSMDVFRGRIMFPIFDVDAKPVAFGGRILPGGEGPKYKNSQEGPLYSKRRILYGLNWAKANVVEVGEVIVCEGYTDVIAFHRAGLPRAVATCGTALADEHMQRLKNFSRRIVLAYDADPAGQGAAEKFYAWEQKLGLDIAVLRLPPGTDPGELGTRDPDALRAAVAAARPFLAFRVERLLEAADPSSVEGRARGADLALEAIGTHPNSLVRDQYVMQVADWARVPAERLRVRMEELRSAPPRPVAERSPRRRGDDGPGPRPDGDDDDRHLRTRPTMAAVRYPPAELEALRLAIHQPDSVAAVLEDVLFSHNVTRAAFHALLDAPTLREAIVTAEPEVAALLSRLGMEEPGGDADDVVALLARNSAQRAIVNITSAARSNQELVDLRWAKERMDALSDPDRRVAASAQLVAWLSGSGEEGS